MKKLILLLILILSMNQLNAEKIAWKIQDSLSYSSMKSMSFSDNGDTLIVNNGDQLIFLNSYTGQEIKRLNSKSFFLISKDFCFGVSKNGDTFHILSTYTGDTISHINAENFGMAGNYRQMVFSHDSKLLFISITNYLCAPAQKYGKSSGKIYIIRTETGELLSTLFDKQNDSLGYSDNIFFDKKDTNSLYIPGYYLNVDDSNEIIIKRVYRYNLTNSSVDTLYSEYSQYDEFGKWREPIRIFPTEPYGCAKDENEMYYSFSLIYPFNQSYGIEEGLPYKYIAMKDFVTMIIAYQKDYTDNIILGKFKKSDQWNLWWFATWNMEQIDTFDNYKGSIWIVNNSSSNSFAVALYDKSEIIMYDSTITDISNLIDSNILLISPNPASDYIEISYPPSEKRGPGGVLSPAGGGQGVDLRIYDVLGMEQPTSPQPLSMLGEGAVRLDVSSLPPGIYFVRIGDFIRKFVKL